MRKCGDAYDKKPAIVRFIGQESEYIDTDTNKQIFTYGKTYNAYFLEYWEGKRNLIHVGDNAGKFQYCTRPEDFEIISDEDNVLNDYEAIVKCIKSPFDGDDNLNVGREYKAIGRDKSGDYLVLDNTYCCCFYEPRIFEIVSDPHGILKEQSIYKKYCASWEKEPDNDWYVAHKFSSRNRSKLKKDKICGCFNCLAIFSPSEIEEWIPETRYGRCVTAICPYCEIDSVIGESSGYPITKKFLREMQKHWFGKGN